MHLSVYSFSLQSAWIQCSNDGIASSNEFCFAVWILAQRPRLPQSGWIQCSKDGIACTTELCRCSLYCRVVQQQAQLMSLRLWCLARQTLSMTARVWQVKPGAWVQWQALDVRDITAQFRSLAKTSIHKHPKATCDRKVDDQKSGVWEHACKPDDFS